MTGATKSVACLALGADHAINYKTSDFVEQAKTLTKGQGVNVILDMVGGSYVAREVECLAEDGWLVIIAVQGGVKAEFNAGLVLRRRLTITGSTLRPRSLEFKTAIAAALKEKVWPLIASGAIRPADPTVSFMVLQSELTEILLGLIAKYNIPLHFCILRLQNLRIPIAGADHRNGLTNCGA